MNKNKENDSRWGECAGGNNVWWWEKEYKNKNLIIVNSKIKTELKNNNKNIKK